MFFELTNASTIFQIHIYVILKKFLNFFVVIYLNDILILFKTKKKHAKHVRFVLNKFRAHKLYVNFENVNFLLKKLNS